MLHTRCTSIVANSNILKQSNVFSNRQTSKLFLYDTQKKSFDSQQLNKQLHVFYSSSNPGWFTDKSANCQYFNSQETDLFYVRNLTTYFNPFVVFVELISANYDVQCVDYRKKYVRYDLSFYFRLRVCTFNVSIEGKHDQCEERRGEGERTLNIIFYAVHSSQ